MMVDRRTFIQGATLLTAASALAARLPHSSIMQTGIAGSEVDPFSVNFKIDGWDHGDRKGSTGEEVSIRINQSWRTAWR